MDIEQYIVDVIREKRKGRLVRPFLQIFGLCYRFIIFLRHFFYDRQIFTSSALNVPVISIGNLVVGGTGKTPVTHLLAIALQSHFEIAILTRGFRSEVEKKKEICHLSKGFGPLYPPTICGDEPYFLAKNSKAAVWVGIDRVASGIKAIKAGAHCLILDDGMQHRRIKRVIEIVVIDAQDPISKGRFLPCGFLRDSPKRLKHADLIVMTHCYDLNTFEQGKQIVRAFSKAPIVATQVTVTNKETFSKRKVGVFCGIGTPERFLKTVRDLNQEIVDTFFLKDHGTISDEMLCQFAKRCSEKGAEALLCTEKDAVKLSADCLPCLEIIPVKIQLEILKGQEHWQAMIQTIIDKVKR